MDVQYEKVCALLTDTIMLMCKNGIQFRNELKVQGLIGLTVDKHVFIIQINEVVKAEEQNLKKLQITPSTPLHGVNFADNDSTQENDAIDYYDSAFSYGGQPQFDGDISLRRPIELSKKTHNNIKEEVEMSPVGSNQIVYEQQDQRNVKEIDMLQNNHSSFEGHSLFNNPCEQNSPINLRVGNKLQVVEVEEDMREPPDIKPLAGDLEEWFVNTMPPDPVSNERPYKKHHRMRRTEVLNLKTSSRSFDANVSCNSLFKSAHTRYNEKKRSTCDDYEFDECEVSKFSCNLCPAAYKHYCNLLTHEVKVHGRQKKKGGRRKKLL